MSPWYEDDKATLLVGDAAAVLATLADESVDCVVTSPPYYATRNLGDGQVGQEPTPAAYLAALRTVFREVRRVLRDDGWCWINLGDVYAAGSAAHRAVETGRPPVPVKSLLGLPWRLALGLQADGWLTRSEVIWSKPNAIPESCRDRPARKHEQLFLLTKSPSYYFNLDAIRQPYTGDRALSRGAHRSAIKPNTARGTWPPTTRCSAALGPSLQPTALRHTSAHAQGRNPGTVWTIPTRPTRHAHTAAFPIGLAQRAIAAGCRPGGIVLDPFSGSGTTVEAAVRLSRRAVAIELREEFHHLALARLRAADGESGRK